MTYREARWGGTIAGAVLLALPVLEVLYNVATPGPVHFVVSALGMALLAVAGRLR